MTKDMNSSYSMVTATVLFKELRLPLKEWKCFRIGGVLVKTKKPNMSVVGLLPSGCSPACSQFLMAHIKYWVH